MSYERRIKREIKDWPKQWSYIRNEKKIGLKLLMNNNGDYVHFLENNINSSKNKIFHFKIDAGDAYPFGPPKVLCNDKSLLTLYRDIHNSPVGFLKKDMQLLTGNVCGCCQSYLCKDNWNPMKKILDILAEFHDFWICWKRSIERFHCKKITAKYLIEHLPIHEYL
jgi:ubiquitin-protein ligase